MSIVHLLWFQQIVHVKTIKVLAAPVKNHWNYSVLKTYKLSCEILHKLQKAWLTTIVMEVLKSLDASMGMQTANICCFWRIVPLIHKLLWNINCVLSTKLHKYHIASWLGHCRAYQGVIQAAPGTESCVVLYGLRDGHWLKSFCKYIHFTLVAWQHCTQWTVVNCVHQCGCGCEVNTEAVLGAGNEVRTGIS